MFYEYHNGWFAKKNCKGFLLKREILYISRNEVDHYIFNKPNLKNVKSHIKAGL